MLCFKNDLTMEAQSLRNVWRMDDDGDSTGNKQESAIRSVKRNVPVPCNVTSQATSNHIFDTPHMCR